MRSALLSWFLLVLLKPFETTAQLSLKTPLICHNSNNQLERYDDGSFTLFFEQGKFSHFSTHDSAVQFYENGRYLLVNPPQPGQYPIKIQLKGSAIRFNVGDSSMIIDSAITTRRSINDILFSFYKQNLYYRVAFFINEQQFYLDVDITGYPKKMWTWDMITVKQDSSSFHLGYNPFYYKGPDLISRQDQRLRFGVNISHSFKSNKYVWQVAPVFYEDTETSRVINVLPDFYYVYNRKGKLKPKKCIGPIRYCGRP